jgi:integrase
VCQNNRGLEAAEAAAAPTRAVTPAQEIDPRSVTLKRAWVVENDIPAGKQAKKLPVVMIQDEVARFLAAVDNLKHRVILTIRYATGLRISEVIRLTPDASTASAW